MSMDTTVSIQRQMWLWTYTSNSSHSNQSQGAILTFLNGANKWVNHEKELVLKNSGGGIQNNSYDKLTITLKSEVHWQQKSTVKVKS
jgi:hypothetical protein